MKNPVFYPPIRALKVPVQFSEKGVAAQKHCMGGAIMGHLNLSGWTKCKKRGQFPLYSFFF